MVSKLHDRVMVEDSDDEVGDVVEPLQNLELDGEGIVDVAVQHTEDSDVVPCEQLEDASEIVTTEPDTAVPVLLVPARAVLEVPMLVVPPLAAVQTTDGFSIARGYLDLSSLLVLCLASIILGFAVLDKKPSAQDVAMDV
ncbi:uncharacterized protein G2W53_002221 [Senna tora]|uniref:Uncharacterized protein n=1 Tax=Senna tora TaxID=362788 RepID=A0A834XK53_9FABA|nr:uncharacterized protein G2W53_002221 [Senna tora]